MVPFLRHVCLKDQETWFDGASLVPSMIYHFQMVGKFCSSLGGFNTYSMAGTNTLGFKTDSMGLSSNRVCGISDCLGELTCSKKKWQYIRVSGQTYLFSSQYTLALRGSRLTFAVLIWLAESSKTGDRNYTCPPPGQDIPTKCQFGHWVLNVSWEMLLHGEFVHLCHQSG